MTAFEQLIFLESREFQKIAENMRELRDMDDELARTYCSSLCTFDPEHTHCYKTLLETEHMCAECGSKLDTKFHYYIRGAKVCHTCYRYFGKTLEA